FLIGLAPVLVAPLLERGALVWAPEFARESPRLVALAPLGWISVMGLSLVAGLSLAAAALGWALRKGGIERYSTWGCGYLAATPRIQYTSSSFAQMLVLLFSWALRPRTHCPGELPLFPMRADFHSEVPDAVLDEAVLPTFHFGAWLFSWLRI